MSENINIMTSDFWKNIYHEGWGEFDVDDLPWNIGVPQPEVAAIIDQLSGPVLDAGCGIGVTANYLASIGKTPVVGADISSAAIDKAKSVAESLELSDKVTFLVTDITQLQGYDGYFNAIVDSTLFHSLPVDARDAYQQAVYKAAAPGAQYAVLVFANDAWEKTDPQAGPNGVTQAELESVLSPYWIIDSIEPAFIHTRMGSEKSQESSHAKPRILGHDEHNRPKIPAWFARAHKK